MKTYTSIIASKNSRVINSTIRLITDLLLYILLLGLLASLPISGLFAQDKWTKIADFSAIIGVEAEAFTIKNVSTDIIFVYSYYNQNISL